MTVESVYQWNLCSTYPWKLQWYRLMWPIGQQPCENCIPIQNAMVLTHMTYITASMCDPWKLHTPWKLSTHRNCIPIETAMGGCKFTSMDPLLTQSWGWYHNWHKSWAIRVCHYVHPGIIWCHRVTRTKQGQCRGDGVKRVNHPIKLSIDWQTV